LFRIKKYSYKRRGLDITRANHVWSTDITYIKYGERNALRTELIVKAAKLLEIHEVKLFDHAGASK